MAAKKTRKKAPARPKDIKESIVSAALALAAEKGWAKVSLRDIARRARLSLAELRMECEDKIDILTLLGRRIDRRVLENPPAEGAPRDRMFEILMTRFDVFQEDRAGIVAMLDGLLTEPKQALLSFPHLCRSMNWMLEAAGVETSGAKGAAKILALSALYIKVLKDWKEDESEDLSRTMASLDQALSRVEALSERFGL